MKERTIIPRAAYLVLPVSEYVGNHQIRFSVGGKLVDDITLRLDYKNPSAYSYYPIGKWMGKPVTLSVTPGVEPEDLQTDDPANAKRGEVFRPFLHFTPVYGWNNDPNGLLEYTSPVTGKTVWHMFYQFNPYDWVWGNMHWGHAVSEDLLHWTHLDTALYPDETGTMFSGSAIVDRENRTGLKNGDEDVILLYYTAAGNTSALSEGKKFTQCLAYSTDGGMTFTKYDKNPVVDHIRADNRDPKVIWCEELKKYLMAIYLDGDEYELLTSDDLLSWSRLQTVAIEGDAECPDIYPLKANGDPADRKWIMSGASHRYIVGTFEGSRFRVLQNARKLNYGSSSYAAQTFSTYDEYERIQIAWDRDMRFGNATFDGQMGIPCSMSLKKDEKEDEKEAVDVYTLCAEPIAALNGLIRDEKRFDGAELTSVIPLEESAYELDLALDPKCRSGKLKIDLFGQTIQIDAELNTLRVGRDTMPIRTLRGAPRLRIVIDKGSAEVFASGGSSMMTVPWLLNFNHREAVFSCEDAPVMAHIVLKRLSL